MKNWIEANWWIVVIAVVVFGGFVTLASCRSTTPGLSFPHTDVTANVDPVFTLKKVDAVALGKQVELIKQKLATDQSVVSVEITTFNNQLKNAQTDLAAQDAFKQQVFEALIGIGNLATTGGLPTTTGAVGGMLFTLISTIATAAHIRSVANGSSTLTGAQPTQSDTGVNKT